jgi:zona occludens toxin (predicted ATPase)
MVTGAPGSGKSFYAVREIAAALDKGKTVATNIQLVDGWALKVARCNVLRRLIPGRCAKTAAEYERRVLITPDLDELFRVRLHGSGEGRGVMVLDEAHNWMNARTWDADETGKAANKGEAVRRRLAVVRFFSQHRKLGWTVLLITQDEANIDRQVRSLFEYHVKLKNVRNFKVMGVPICPCNVFIAIWLWNDKSKSRVKVQTYGLKRSIARLYDTMALSHGMDDDECDPIYLPRAKTPPIPTNDCRSGSSSTRSSSAAGCDNPTESAIAGSAGGFDSAELCGAASAAEPSAPLPQ